MCIHVWLWYVYGYMGREGRRTYTGRISPITLVPVGSFTDDTGVDVSVIV